MGVSALLERVGSRGMRREPRRMRLLLMFPLLGVLLGLQGCFTYKGSLERGDLIPVPELRGEWIREDPPGSDSEDRRGASPWFRLETHEKGRDRLVLPTARGRIQVLPVGFRGYPAVDFLFLEKPGGGEGQEFFVFGVVGRGSDRIEFRVVDLLALERVLIEEGHREKREDFGFLPAIDLFESRDRESLFRNLALVAARSEQLLGKTFLTWHRRRPGEELPEISKDEETPPSGDWVASGLPVQDPAPEERAGSRAPRPARIRLPRSQVCDCRGREDWDRRLRLAEEVFLGTVEGIESTRSIHWGEGSELVPFSPMKLVHFRVRRRWKGGRTRSLQVLLPGDGPGRCGVAMAVGKEYLVVAHSDSALLRTDRCSGTGMPTKEALEAVGQRLGPGEVPASGGAGGGWLEP